MRNIKTVQVFVDAGKFAQWQKKTPLFRNLLSRFTQISPDQWTEAQKVSHQYFADLQKWFTIKEVA